MREANYIEIDKVIMILELAVKKGQISREVADLIIDEINDKVNTSKFKSVDWKFGQRW